MPPPQTGLVLTLECPSDTITSPMVSSVSPASGAAAGGETVLIEGPGFVGVKSVSFGQVAATSYTTETPTLIGAVVPPGSGTVDITVTNGTGTSTKTTAAHLTYLGPPVISMLSPGSGPAPGGSTVTITGFGLIGVQTLTVAGQDVAFSTVSDAELTFVAPAGSGTAQVVVSSPCSGGLVPPIADSCGTSSPASFTYVASLAELAFTTGPPPSTSPGTTFNVNVSVEDANGNVVTSDSSTSVKLAITTGTGTAGAALACSSDPVTGSAGVASFSCSISEVGENYALTATSGSLKPATSGDIDVVATSAPTLSLQFTGALSYKNSGGVISGDITVSPATGTVSSVTGTASIRGLRGGSATVTAIIYRVKGVYVGSVIVSDPSAALSTVSPVLTPLVTRTVGGLATGTAAGLYHGRPFLLSFTL